MGTPAVMNYFPVTISVHDETETRGEMAALLQKVLLTDVVFDFQLLTGGKTNRVYVATSTSSTSSDGPRPCLVRLFGQGSEGFLDRDRGLAVAHALSQQGLGPAVHARFANGTVEEFVPSRTLEPNDISRPEVQARIAASLGRFHTANVAGPSPPEGFHAREINRLAGLLVDRGKRPGGGSCSDMGEVDPLLRSLIDLVAPVLALTRTLGTAADMVLCHNDLLAGNILECAAPREGLLFIDFEFTEYGHKYLDIGNHFTKYTGYTSDWSKYPSPEAQVNFLAAYGVERGSEAMASALRGCHVGSLASLLLWALWAMAQAQSHDAATYAAGGGFNMRAYAMSQLGNLRAQLGLYRATYGPIEP